LRGDQAIGVYALREYGARVFIADDFNVDGWRNDIVAYWDAARKCGVEVSIERSRSGYPLF